MNRICSQYTSKVYLLFPFHGKRERTYIKSFKHDINNYCEEEQVTSIEDLYKQFGTPSEVVANYLSSVDTQNLLKRINRKKYIRIFFSAALITLLICILSNCFLTYEIHQSHKRMDKVFLEYIAK